MPYLTGTDGDDHTSDSLDGLNHSGPGSFVSYDNGSDQYHEGSGRRRIVVVGLGMVAISFIEKVIKYDAESRQFDLVVLGEEPYFAYNRVGLTSFFEHRKIENLYLEPKEWYTSIKDRSFDYHINTRVTEIVPNQKVVKTSGGVAVSYDILVLATGSDAVVPRSIPGNDAKGIFVYRTISDLENLIDYASMHKGQTAVTVGGGLLGLEAAKAMTDLNDFGNVKIINRSKWVLSRQLDADAGSLVNRKIRELGIDLLLDKSIRSIDTDEDNSVTGITLGDGQRIDCCCVCLATGISPRDDLIHNTGIQRASRGGFVVNDNLQTNIPDIYAIGECASWENQTFGIIAPGIEMAEVLSFNLTNPDKEPKQFSRPDMSTKLKLLGVDVASFGDFFADRDGPKFLPGKRPATSVNEPPVKALTYMDPFGGVYKKYLFTMDGEYLLGGMMIGDTKDYLKLNQMVKKQAKLEVPPSMFILGAQKEGDDGADDLDDSTQICSCHNVSKGTIAETVKNGTCKAVDQVKSCTKAGTGCGGCMPLVQSIFNRTLIDMGQEVTNHLCRHFPYSRVDLYHIIAVKQLKTFSDIMKTVGKNPNSLGCEACKPAIASILSSQYNQHIMDRDLHDLQETNDKFLANIQRDGTFSVVPRVPAGEITADKLIAIGSVAKKFNLYCKITGGQRIDMFGAKKQDLLDIWTELVNAGLESGHAYAKSLRTVKSCVGTSWCRFGIGDSVGMAVRLEERYKSIRSPHKLKGGVSGCVRECAEAQSKDFGLISTDKGFNIYVGGNGGAKPRHTELLARDIPPEQVIPVVDRYLIFYIRTADKLQRTARWLENLPGGINYLREVVLDDKLGINADLEQQMQKLVESYFCEWTETVRNPDRRKWFQQFANTSESVNTVEVIKERDQPRPAYWPKDPATDDFRGHQWSSLSWQPILQADYFSFQNPHSASATVKRGDTQLAVFKVQGKYYATQQMCPHKRAFVLSDGLIGDDDAGKFWVSCPQHKRNFELNGEQAGRCSNDESMNIATFPVEERDDGWVYLKLPPVEELDSVLGTEKWKVKKDEAADPFEKVDRKYGKGTRGKKNGQAASSPPKSTIDW